MPQGLEAAFNDSECTTAAPLNSGLCFQFVQVIAAPPVCDLAECVV